jgi:hypothetical protein
MSDTPLAIGPFMGGSGLAEGSADATGMDGYSILGEAVFNVLFTVTTTGPVTLDADVSFAGDTPPFGGFALVELSIDMGPVLHGIAKGVGDPGAASLLVSPVLTMGTTYRLRAVAHVDGGSATGGDFDVMATWDFTLASIPEASALFLTAPVALGAALAAWRRRRLTTPRQSPLALGK